MPQTAAIAVVEIAIVAAGGQAGKIELDGEMELLIRRQPFEQVGDLEVRSCRLRA